MHWTEEVPLSSETVVHTITPPAQDNGAPTLLVVRALFVHAEGWRLQPRGLPGQFVVASDGAYASTDQQFTGATWEGPVTDPNDAVPSDEEGAP